ncbi:hypothetical protein C8F04DRAFT_69359 [Mycena alexandri]|uniref:Uncharacterized protein n=1 Tax=Mycena alexandri TaxID=1745969 RepID=A0AAD6SIH4_9AGAR|nr:hypothetical protein C8F04DRAFT_69359 [Mycena alexandri]
MWQCLLPSFPTAMPSRSSKRPHLLPSRLPAPGRSRASRRPCSSRNAPSSPRNVIPSPTSNFRRMRSSAHGERDWDGWVVNAADDVESKDSLAIRSRAPIHLCRRRISMTKARFQSHSKFRACRIHPRRPLLPPPRPLAPHPLTAALVPGPSHSHHPRIPTPAGGMSCCHCLLPFPTAICRLCPVLVNLLLLLICQRGRNPNPQSILPPQRHPSHWHPDPNVFLTIILTCESSPPRPRPPIQTISAVVSKPHPYTLQMTPRPPNPLPPSLLQLPRPSPCPARLLPCCRGASLRSWRAHLNTLTWADSNAPACWYS